jgi:hypothetical protein
LLNRPSFAEAGLSDFKRMKNNPMQSIDAAPPFFVSNYELA